MKPKHKLHHFLALTGISLLAVSSASAQATSNTWNTNAAGNWTDPLNWLGDTAYAEGAHNTATFGDFISANTEITLNAPITIGNIIASDTSHNYTISGANILTLDRTTGVPIIDVTQSGRGLTISSQISGSDGLQKEGAGILLLNGTNDYTGGTVIKAGRLHMASDAALGNSTGSITLDGGLLHARSNLNTGSSGGGAVNISSARNVIVETGGGGIAANGNNNFTTSGTLSGAGTLTFINVGGAGGRSLNFNSTANDFTGRIVIESNGSTFQVNSLADSSNNIAFNATGNGSGTFRYGSDAITALTLTDRAFELNGGATGVLTGTIENSNTTHAITINSDLVATGNGAKTLGLAGGNATPDNLFAGVIANETDGGSGIVSVTKSGGGRWTLDGTNTYTGNTTVSGGTLTLASNSSTQFAIGASGVNNAVLGNGTANLNGTFFFDLANAGTNDGDFWNIVSVGTLTESYGDDFFVESSLGDFSGNAGVWSLVAGNNAWTFTEGTGVLGLSVIPEPSTALLGGLGFLALLRRRR